MYGFSLGLRESQTFFFYFVGLSVVSLSSRYNNHIKWKRIWFQHCNKVVVYQFFLIYERNSYTPCFCLFGFGQRTAKHSITYIHKWIYTPQETGPAAHWWNAGVRWSLQRMETLFLWIFQMTLLYTKNRLQSSVTKLCECVGHPLQLTIQVLGFSVANRNILRNGKNEQKYWRAN